MIRSLLLVFLLFFTTATAQEDRFNIDRLHDEVKTNPLNTTTEGGSVAEEESSPVIIVFRIIGSLALLSIIIVGVVWGLRKTGMANKLATNTDASLELLEELPTAVGNSLVLVRFRDKVLLLGQTSSSILNIDTVEGEEALEIIADSAGGKSVGTFRANLNKYVQTLQKGNERV